MARLEGCELEDMTMLIDGGSVGLVVDQIDFEANTTGITSASTTLSGTLKLYTNSTVKSINGVYTLSSMGYSSPIDTVSGNVDSEGTLTVSLSSLSFGTRYLVRTKAYSGLNSTGTSGEYQYTDFITPVLDTLLNQAKAGTDEYDGSEIVTAYQINKDISVSKSLLQIHTEANKPNTVSAAVKETSIAINQSTPAYYNFGTSLFFKSTEIESRQSGGIGFFVSGSANTGYFVLIKTSQTSQLTGDEYSILKIEGGNVKKLEDSQSVTTGGGGIGVYAAREYKVNVKVMVTDTKVIIKAFVNGFAITATDTNTSATSTKKANKILPRTSKIALFANLGTVNFDYAFAMPITAERYASAEMENVYTNQFATSAASLAYGDLFVSGIQNIESQNQLKFIEEFGPVAREIRYVKQRYDRTPAFPKYIHPNLNTSVDVLGNKLNSFSSEMYLINNSGTTADILSSDGTKISVLGSSIVRSSETLEYMDDSINKYDSPDPVSFDTKWIQNNVDAKNLSDWIKGQWSRQQMILDINVFANPLISVGDIITVNYPYQGLDTSKKFVVTNVTQDWNNGLSTAIRARSIYS
jgi:hypothetical protein